LFFLSQIIHPRKILGLEALVSRFFAILTVSLIITGFFALLYSYFSVSFPLFLLNSFLISFAVLALWSPLLLFFRYLARSVFRTRADARLRALEEFRLRLPAITALDELQTASFEFLARQYGISGFRFVLDSAGGAVLPEPVIRHFERLLAEKQAPVLWREPLEREREQVLIRARRRELDRLIRFLRSNRVTIAFAVVRSGKIEGWIGVDGFLGMHASSLLIEILHEIAGHASRILQLEATRERERLVLLGEMAAGLAHEVRNPLGAIRGAADLLDPGSGPWIKVIREEVDRLNRLVSQFLDFSRDQKETRELTDLNALVETVIGQIRPGIPGGIHLEWRPVEGPVRGEVAPDSVRQVLMNLIQNSVKALQEQRNPVIQVLTFRTGFLVSDNGIGMEEEVISRAFEPFFTSFREGTGLGLSIVEKLVRFDGGRVSIRSKRGQGTEVRVEYADARPDSDHR
jgi:two-component system sensor histidine kinase HydH